MPTADYYNYDSTHKATLTVPDTHELPRVITIPMIVEGGTKQQHFYREDHL